MPRLRVFSTNYKTTYAEGFSRFLAACPALEVLKMRGESDTYMGFGGGDRVNRIMNTVLVGISSSLRTLSLTQIAIDLHSVSGVHLHNLETLILDRCGRGAPSAVTALAQSNPSLQHLRLVFDGNEDILSFLELPSAQLLSIHITSEMRHTALGKMVQEMMHHGVFAKTRSMRFQVMLGVSAANLCGVEMPELRVLTLPQSLGDEANMDIFREVLAPALQFLTLKTYASLSMVGNASKIEELKMVLGHSAGVPDDVTVCVE
jgi:hypothetical protein